MRSPIALVMSDDAIIAALIGAMAELADLDAGFLRPGESARTALRRLRPALVLADCTQEDAGSDSFIGPALMTGARIALFCAGSHAAHDRTKAMADRHGPAFFILPADTEALQQWIATMAAGARGHGVRKGA